MSITEDDKGLVRPAPLAKTCNAEGTSDSLNNAGTNYRDPNFLKGHIRRIIEFYHPACMDYEYGGFINQFLDDGTVYDRFTKHLVGTCRFVYCFSVASMVLNSDEYRRCASHGITFLLHRHRQQDGGFAWLMRGRDVVDGTNHCYGHAFVLLAAAAAGKAGIKASEELFAAVWDVLENRFWDPSSQLYVDEITSGDWTEIESYRGQNANMHLCEALLATYEATNSGEFLDRAEVLARRICVDLAAPANGLIWEHYHEDWSHDWDYNRVVEAPSDSQSPPPQRVVGAESRAAVRGGNGQSLDSRQGDNPLYVRAGWLDPRHRSVLLGVCGNTGGGSASGA